MFSKSTMMNFVLFTFTMGAVAKPVIKIDSRTANLAVASKFKLNASSGATIADIDKARAQALKHNYKSMKRDGSSSVSVTDASVSYTAAVGVGNPPTNYTLLVDTGSSNTWIGANKPYKPTNTSQSTNSSFSVIYGSGFVFGTEYIDTVTLGDNLIITGQSIGVANESSEFNGQDGILGLGPTDLTAGTVSDASNVPTVMDKLVSQDTISEGVLGVFYVPSAENDTTGELTFGGIDTSKNTTDVAYVPITSTSPASDFWGINQTIGYGSTTILDTTAGIVDTGTTLILLASDAFQRYMLATGATLDQTTGLLAISSSNYDKLSDLDFTIGNNTYSLTPNAQIWPRSLNSQLGGTDGNIYLVVSDLGSNSGEGFDFVNGYTFLQRFYSVFDTTNSQVGFAETEYTSATSN